MSQITEAQLRRAIRDQLIRKLNEAPENTQGAIDLTSVAEQVSDEIHKRMKDKARVLVMRAKTDNPQGGGGPERALKALEAGEARVVKVMARGARDGKPSHLVIRAEMNAPVPLTVVLNKDYTRRYGAKYAWVFDDEQEMRFFLDESLKKHRLAADDMKVVALETHSETGERTFGYVVNLKRI